MISTWVDGRDALAVPGREPMALATEVAAFVNALRAIDPTDGPRGRGRVGALAPHTEHVLAALDKIGELDDIGVDVDRCRAVWEAALAARPWDGTPRWTHGDLLLGNILLDEHGHVTGVIDWSAGGVGDSTCDAMLAWSLPPDARARFRDDLAIDDDTWRRAAGWSVQQAAMYIPYYLETIPDAVAESIRRLEAITTDPTL